MEGGLRKKTKPLNLRIWPSFVYIKHKVCQIPTQKLIIPPLPNPHPHKKNCRSWKHLQLLYIKRVPYLTLLTVLWESWRCGFEITVSLNLSCSQFLSFFSELTWEGLRKTGWGTSTAFYPSVLRHKLRFTYQEERFSGAVPPRWCFITPQWHPTHLLRLWHQHLKRDVLAIWEYSNNEQMASPLEVVFWKFKKLCSPIGKGGNVFFWGWGNCWR